MSVLLQSRLGIGRLGAMRLGYYLPYVWVTINGVDRSSVVQQATLQIVDNARSVPSTASMRVSGFTPQVGMSVYVSMGATDRYIFGGAIQRLSKVLQANNINNDPAYDLECQDQNWFLNRLLVYGRYQNQDVGTIVRSIISEFTDGFTDTNVASGIGTVDDIIFNGSTVSEAFSQLASLFPGPPACQWYVDYNKDIHFYTTDTVPRPATVTLGNTLSFLAETDLSQVRTRVDVIGGGTTTGLSAVPGDTTLSVADTSYFDPSGGQFITPDAQIVDYTGTEALGEPSACAAAPRTGGYHLISPLNRSGSTASVVTTTPHGFSTGDRVTISGADQPEYNGVFSITVTGGTAFDYQVSGSPTTPATGTISCFLDISGSIGVGVYQYAVTYISATGETDKSPLSSGATIAAVSAPTAPSAAMVSGQAGSLTAGVYTYAVTYLTSQGETLHGATGSVTVTTLANVGSGASVTSGATGNLAVGTYTYLMSLLTSSGETIPYSSGASASVTAISTPTSPTATTAGTTGNLTVGTYRYQVTFVTASGETASTVSVGTAVISSVSVPSAPSGTATTGGSMAAGTYRYQVTYVTATGETTGSNGSAGVTVSAPNNAVSLTSISTSSDSRVTSRRIYRYVSALGQWLLVTTIANNTSTTYTDTAADASLGAAIPATNTAASGQVLLTSIATSADPRVTKRRIYRTSVNGSTYKLLTTINDNSTTTYSDNTPDASLSNEIPTTDTASTGTITVSTPTSSDPRVIGRKVYRVFGSAHYLVATINDNTTTSVVDNIPDSSLTTVAPTVDTASSAQVSVTIPTSSDARVLSRVVYRSAVGGTILQRVAVVSDNSTTSYTDNTPDSALGIWASTVDSSGGGQIRVTSIPTSPDPRVTGRRVYRTKANTGADPYLLTTIGDNTTTQYLDNTADESLSLTQPPVFSTIYGLTGIPASGAGAIVRDIPAGTQVRLFVRRDDPTAQAALAALEGGDGIHDHQINDTSIISVAQAQAAGDADLLTFGGYEPKVTYTTYDLLTVGGVTVTVDTQSPMSVSGDYVVQSVTLSGIGLGRVSSAPYLFPKRSVRASRTRFTLTDLLRRVSLGS